MPKSICPLTLGCKELNPSVLEPLSFGCGCDEREKGCQLGADTRLITPYTNYLLRGFE